MKKSILVGAVALVAGSLFAADSASLDDIKSAAKKLGAKKNYSWKSTVDAAGGGGNRGRVGPTEGKTEKDGFTVLSMTRGDSTTEAVLKGGKGAVKTADGWKSTEEATEGGGGGGGGGGGNNPARMIGRMLQTFKAPAAEAEDLAGKVKELKKSEDGYVGDLTEDAVKQLLSRGRRGGGGDAPAASNAKGSVKFWVKDGVLSKYRYNVQGDMTFNGNDVNINRTTTVDIKDVDSTQVEVAEEAKKKLT